MNIKWSDTNKYYFITTTIEDEGINISAEIIPWDNHSTGWEWEVEIDNSKLPVLIARDFISDDNIDKCKQECEKWIDILLGVVRNGK